MGKFTAFIFLLLMASCQPAVDLEQETAGLLQTDRDFAAMASEQGTAEAFRTYFESDGIQFPNGYEPVRGRKAIYEGLLGVPEDYALHWDPELAEVAPAGDMGWTWGYFSASYTDSTGKPVKNYGKYLTVWRRQSDGSWMVRADIGNKNPKPGKQE